MSSTAACRSSAVAGAALPPPGFRVTLAAGVLVTDGGRLLVGGAPLRLTRLSARVRPTTPALAAQ